MSFFEKILSTLGIYEYVETEEDDEEESNIKQPEERPKIAAVPSIEPRDSRKPAVSAAAMASVRDNVVMLPPSNKQVSVMLVRPLIFDDAQVIADYIKSGRPVVVNFEDAGEQVKKRIIDFISGTIYALNGRIKMVGTKTMIGTPHNVDIEELASNTDFSWRK